jgi:hypothetical protein
MPEEILMDILLMTIILAFAALSNPLVTLTPRQCRGMLSFAVAMAGQ